MKKTNKEKKKTLERDDLNGNHLELLSKQSQESKKLDQFKKKKFFHRILNDFFFSLLLSIGTNLFFFQRVFPTIAL